MSLEEHFILDMSLESDVIAFIQDYSAKNEGDPPSKNAIVKGVPGLHNSKFYDLFGSVANAYNLAGIEAEKTEDKMVRARNSRERILAEKETRDFQGSSEYDNIIMRVLGETKLDIAKKRAAAIVSMYAKLAFMYDIKSPEDFQAFYIEQINKMKNMAQDAVDISLQYSSMDLRQALEWCDISPASFKLMDYCAKKNKMVHYHEAGMINGIIQQYFLGPPHYVKVIESAPILGKVIRKVKKLTDEEIAYLENRNY